MKATPRKEAFSLVEVVVALGVVAVGFIALLGLLPAGLQAASASRLETEANHLARTLIAELQRLPYGNHTFYGQAVDLTAYDEETLPLQYYSGGSLGNEPLFHIDPTDRPLRVELRFKALVEAGERIGTTVFVKIARSGEGAYHYGTVIGRY